MHPVRAGLLPGQRRLARRAVAGFATGLPLHEAHSLSIGNIDGGQQHKTHDCASLALGSVDVFDAVLMVRSLRSLTGAA
ncbi:hypothetical protein GCM10023319_10800 [Nocardia iowensis]